ncbi:MAG: PAS domain-containing protein, partial [Deltaproteobacteria bacterium]
NRRISEPILKAIYVDMLAERADMARNLIKAISSPSGADNIYIIRSNGVEEAFKDLKTINEVRERIGYVRPEWLHEHLEVKDNVAEDAMDRNFKNAVASFQSNRESDATYYVKHESGAPVLIYLQPIYRKPECGRCHGAESSRGVLVIKTSLAGMYAEVERDRGKMLLYGLIGISLGGIFLSMLVRKSITGPIQKNVDVIKKIADGKADISERLEVHSRNEIGYLSAAFNNLLDTIEKRAEENKKLFEMVAKSRQEWVATFDAIQDLIAIHDRENRVLKVNRALSRKFNAEPEDLIGKKCREIFYGENGPGKTCPYSDTLITAAVAAVEADDLAFEGTYKITTFPVFNSSGDVWACVHIARDITQEKLLRE